MKDLRQIRIENITAVIDAFIEANPEKKAQLSEILSLNVTFNPCFANQYHLYEQRAIKELKILGLDIEPKDTLEEWKTAYRSTR